MAAITIGSGAVNLGDYFDSTLTVIDVKSPASASGVINTISVFVDTYIATTAYLGIFYRVSGNNFTCRSYTTVASLSVGLNTISNLDLNIITGDFIGIYFSNGRLDFDTVGGTGVYYINVTNGALTANQTYTYYSGGRVGLSATGTTITGKKINGVTLSKWNGIAITKFNGI